MSALFGGPTRSTSKNLVEFRAGKMTMSGKRVTADTRKGQVYVYQSDDGLMHFCWKDRKTGVVEDDLIIFPDDVEYKRVPQCTTGRVYILKFKSSLRKFFFWMQEPKTDKDDEYCSKVNDGLNNPPTPGSNRSNVSSSGGLPSELSNLGISGESDLQNLLSGMSQQQLISLLSGGNVSGGLSGLLSNRRGASTRSRTPASAGGGASDSAATTVVPPPAAASPATTTATTTATTAADTPSTPAAAAAPATPATPAAAGAAVQLSDLQNILSSINVPAAEDSTAASARGGGNVDLSSALTAETLQPMLTNPEFLERLQAFLPSIGNNETLPPAQNLRGTLQSPQFQQALSLFSSALQSGQLAPVISQFDLGEAAVTAAAAGDLEAFVKALQNQQNKDDDMATD